MTTKLLGLQKWRRGLLLVSLCCLGSCSKELQTEELGPAQTIYELAEKFQEIVQSMDDRIQVGDFAVQVQTGSVFGQDMGGDIVYRFDVYERSPVECRGQQGFRIRYREIEEKLVEGKREQFHFDREVCFNDLRSDSFQIFLSNLVLPSQFTNSFHNLRLDITVEEAPDVVQQAGCQGMQTCSMRVYNLRFYQRILTPSGEEDLRLHEYRISPDVPWFARVLEHCIAVKVRVDSLDYPLRQCIRSSNFGRESSSE